MTNGHLARGESDDLKIHAAVCAERYRAINREIKLNRWAIVVLLVLTVANGDGPLTATLLRLLGI